MDVPEHIKELLTQRERARTLHDYQRADELREQIAQLGYTIEDTADATVVKKEENSSSFLIVFGSGEISSVGRMIHERVLSQLQKKNITIGIITTPAGFQPNVITVHEEIKTFFIEHLSNFHPRVEILYANTRDDANDDSLVATIDECDYVFMGPGSPTYAVTHLQNTKLLGKLLDNVARHHLTLCLSSAAALAFSKKCLPVYEIYKVGSPLHWIDGLNVYQQLLGTELSVIPHFNNTEGGSKNDTSHCFMGEKRFNQLLTLVDKTEMIGIDEQTAKIWNLNDKTSEVLGKGSVTQI